VRLWRPPVGIRSFHGGRAWRDARRCAKPEEEALRVDDRTITLTLAKADAEVLLGVLSSERYNAEVEAVCDAVRKQLDEKLAEIG
jgi:hypothetical protein